MKDWFSGAELAGLPGMPSTARGVNKMGERGEIKRQKKSKGKGWEYHYSSLPEAAHAALASQLVRQLPDPDLDQDDIEPIGEEPFTYNRDNLWRWAETRPEKLRQQGMARAALLHEVMTLNRAGQSIGDAFKAVAIAHGLSQATLKGWYYGTKTKQSSKPGARLYRTEDWPAALVPGWTGRKKEADCDPAAWDVFLGLFLTRRAPTLAICHERAGKIARERGWEWPALRTVRRKLKREISPMVITLAREGAEALDKLFPPMRRDRSGFHAMQAVNGDGIDWKRYCVWPDGEVAKPCTWITQDLYSNKLLAWRTDKSENKHMFRLAFGDLVDRWGIPTFYFIDNTMAAASKWLTGGIKNRYRWKIRDEDPIGIMPQMGTTVRFVEPGHGQSKPIERANQELRQRIDTHPKWEGRGTKGRPIPIDEFITLMSEEFEHYNQRTGRTTQVAAGRSFQDVFAESYEKAPIKKATPAQRRLWLCAAEKVRCSRTNGSIVLGRGPQGENRYWCRELVAYCGQLIVVRFDPQNYHQDVHCYTLDGRYIGEAESTWRAGFADSAAAHEFYRAKGQFKRATRKALEAERRMTASTAAKLLPEDERAPDPESKVVQLQPRKRAVGHDVVDHVDENDEGERHQENFTAAMLDVMRQRKSEQL